MNRYLRSFPVRCALWLSLGVWGCDETGCEQSAVDEGPERLDAAAEGGLAPAEGGAPDMDAAGGADDDGGLVRDGASPDGPSGDAALDGALALPDPVPADPCGTDLQEDVGTVRPAFGTLPAPEAFVGQPDQPGPYKVVARDAQIPSAVAGRAALSATFYLPSDDGLAAATGPFPLVLVMHGFSSNHLAYAHFSQHFASHGIIALGLTFPFAATAEHETNAREAIGAIDHALSASGPVPGLVDAEKLAVSGHSMGGKIGFYAAALDPRVDIVIAWDPSNAGGPPCLLGPECHAFPVAPNCTAMDAGLLHQLRAESLVFRANPDAANPEPVHNAEQFFRGAPAPATLLDYGPNALHGDWANALSVPIAHTKALQIALLLQRFRGVTGLEDWLPGGSKPTMGLGVVRVLQK